MILAALPQSIYFHLPILLLVISMVYSATRYDRWENIARETMRWVLRMVVFLGGIAVVMYVISLCI
jgi:hypothetical protein